MRKHLFRLTALLVGLAACEKQNGEQQDGEKELRPAPEISINPDRLVFSPSGGTQQVTITSNYGWGLKGNDNSFDWYHLTGYTTANAVITCTVNSFDGKEERSGKLVFFCVDFNGNMAEAELTIIQTDYSISLDKTELSIDAMGGAEEIAFTSSDDWTISECPNWCTPSARSGSSGDRIKLSFTYNTSTADRSSAIVFSCGDKSVECTVCQSADDSPIIDFKDPLFLNGILSYRSSYDRNKDEEISEREASLITKLDISNGVRNMDEIKYFTALTWLHCPSNQLTTLDVSNNTTLTKLYCYENQLTFLDVNGCTALKYLGCYDNQLTSLDVSECTALTELYCFHNQLTSLDVSNNTALIRLYCYSNQITSLDLSKNKKLTSLELCDYSDNTTITELILYKYHIIGNWEELLPKSYNHLR